MSLSASLSAKVAAANMLPAPPALTDLSLHSLPFKTSFRGTTDIRKHFIVTHAAQTTTTTDINQQPPQLVAHFRGRKLLGTIVDVPRTHMGCIALIPKMSSGTKRSRNDDDDDEGALRSSREAEEDAAAAGSSGQSQREPAGSSTVTILETFNNFIVWEHDRQAPGPERTPLAFLSVARALHRQLEPLVEASSAEV